jgi:opacity protein-like surface antigen
MKKLATAIAAIALIGTPAFAADMAVKMPVKAPPPAPAPVYSWTGWYVGVTAGYGFGNTDQSLTADAAEANIGPPVTHPPPSGLHPAGFVGGGEVGYNYQAGNILAGLEADFSYSGLRQTASATGAPFIGGVLQTTVTTKLHWFGTVRGRLGVLPMNNLLLYATGGFAYGDDDRPQSHRNPPVRRSPRLYILRQRDDVWDLGRLDGGSRAAIRASVALDDQGRIPLYRSRQAVGDVSGPGHLASRNADVDHELHGKHRARWSRLSVLIV